MSRMPPVPPANKPVHGPDGAPKTSIDISHRVKQQARHADASAAETDTVGEDRGLEPLPPMSTLSILVAAAAAAVFGFLAGRRLA